MTKTLIASLAGASFAALALTSGSALAAELGKPVYKAPPPAPAPVYSWTGCYLDAGGGYGMWNQDHYAEYGPPYYVALEETQTSGGRGWLGRVGGGCDYQVAPRWVIGAFADYDFMNIKGTIDSADFEMLGNEKESGAWGVGGRIGYLITPDILTYFDAGYTQARFDQINLEDIYPPSPATGYSIASHTYNGWFVGGGTEASLASFLPGLPTGLFLRTEYRYSGYQSADLPILYEGVPYEYCPASCYYYYEHAQKYVQTVTTSLVWRFNFSGPIATRY